MRASIYDPDVFRSCISMPKLNGLRAMYVPGRGFFTRDGILWPDATLAHIKYAGNLWLDGELYCHGMTLQEITSAVGITRLGPGLDAERVQFHVFDTIAEGTALARRDMLMQTSFSSFSNIVPLFGTLCYSRVLLDECYANYVAAGYEGQMVKAAHGHYVGQGAGKRPTINLQKRKDFRDDEFRCVGVTISDEARIKGLVGALRFVTKNGTPFNCGTGFTDADRREWLANSPVGKTATLRYLYLSEDGIPQNNSFVAWRDNGS
jgi:ATP-dependent DNA ligase